MGHTCETCTADLTIHEVRTDAKAMRLPDFESIHIFDFERRIKLYAHPGNNGKVSISQL